MINCENEGTIEVAEGREKWKVLVIAVLVYQIMPFKCMLSQINNYANTLFCSSFKNTYFNVCFRNFELQDYCQLRIAN